MCCKELVKIEIAMDSGFRRIFLNRKLVGLKFVNCGGWYSLWGVIKSMWCLGFGGVEDSRLMEWQDFKVLEIN